MRKTGSWALGALLVGGAALAATVTWEHWWPDTPVRVERVAAEPIAPGGASQTEAVASMAEPTVVAQASGWIEAEPYLTRVVSLVDGVIASVAVLEGEAVEAGQELARLDSADLDLALRRAEATVRAARAAEAEATARWRAVQATVDSVTAAQRRAEAARDDAADAARRFAGAGDAVTTRQREEARLRQLERDADLAAATAALQEVEADVALAEAAVQSARARRETAEVVRDQAALDRQRCLITAPVAGRIQRLYAFPGHKLMLQMDGPTSAAVCDIYDPQRLQVRVDVPLAEAGHLRVGQGAVIGSTIAPQRTWRGEVVRIEGEADLTRNTLQAKVRIIDPDPVLRPEMLCRVQFLSATGEGPAWAGQDPATGSGGSLLLTLSDTTIDDPAAERTTLWVVDEQRRARRHEVALGGRRGDRVVLRDGVPAGAWVIRDPPTGLQEGALVAVEEVIE